MDESHEPAWRIAAFYRFVALPDYRELQPVYLAAGRELGLCGSLLLASEGLNATIAGAPAALAEMLALLRRDPRLADLNVKYASSPQRPFGKFKVRLKREIVSFGQPDADPLERVGTYVAPTDWNALIQDADVLVLDTRNAYETAIGRFAGARDPQTESFRAFADYVREQLDPQVHRRVAMYCTGGIRCEKASSWMLTQGFEQVYHLEGGILKYLETVPPEDSLWQGECFVFDERVAVNHALDVGEHQMCGACGGAVSAADRLSPDYEPGVCCPACAARQSPTDRARRRQYHAG